MKKVIFLIVLIFSMQVCHTSASDISVLVDGNPVEYDVKPVIQNSRVLVPMRKTFEKLGAQVEWIAELKTVIAAKNNILIVLRIDNPVLIIQDVKANTSKAISLDVAPTIIDGSTIIPIRVISESFNYFVEWDGETQSVAITTQPFYEAI